jgi:hypothetical protein
VVHLCFAYHLIVLFFLGCTTLHFGVQTRDREFHCKGGKKLENNTQKGASLPVQMKLIGDEQELKNFFDYIVPVLAKEEVYFLSLSARNKYLTEEERAFYRLGRTEMFERRIIKDRAWDMFLATVKRYEVAEGAYLSLNGHPVPAKCVMVYWNINPTNAVKAFFVFQQEMSQAVLEYVSNTNASTDVFLQANRKLMNAFQKTRGTKHYIDIDVDFLPDMKDIKHVDNFLDALAARGVKFFVVDTKSGYHVLLKRNTIRFNYTTLVKELNQNTSVIKEAVINENEMIPMPGTFQADHLVRVLYDKSCLT